MSGRVGPLKPLTPPFINTYSMDFDGVDDYVDCGVITSLNGLSAASWSCWLKISPSETFVSPFGQDEVGGNNGIRLFLMSSGRVDIYLSALKYRVQSNATIIGVFDNEWHNLTVTFNNTNSPTNDICKLYIDGVNVPNASTASTAVLPTLTEPFTIGRWEQNAYNFGGNIDEFAIWDSELLQAEVTSIGGGTPTDLSLLATPPINWYRMGDNGSYKSPQWLLPNNENKDKVSNYSFDFDGVDDYIDLGDLSELGGQSQVSVSLWFKRSDNSNRILLDFKEGSSRIAIQFYNTTTLYIYINGVSYNVALPSFALNTWYNLTYVFDGNGSTNADRLKLYIDGVNLIGGTYSATVPTAVGSFTSSMITRLGSLYINSYGWKGNIDEVSIFNSAISIGDVWDGSGEPIDVSLVSGIVSYYKMGEEATFSGGVWTVPDQVGSNDGTSNAMAIEDRVGSAPSSSNNAVSFNMDLIDRVEDTP